MKPFLPILRCSILFSILTLLLLSCNQNPESENEVDIKGKPETKVAFVPLSGKYHFLICSRADFLALKERPTSGAKNGKGLLLFKNNITDSGITLHGWTYKIADTVFSKTPNIKLIMSSDTLSFQSGSYLGDFILSWQDVKDIMKVLRKNPDYKTVVFRPYYYNTDNTLIAYEILFSEYIPSENVMPREKLVSSGKIVNPIPPGGGRAFEE